MISQHSLQSFVVYSISIFAFCHCLYFLYYNHVPPRMLPREVGIPLYLQRLSPYTHLDITSVITLIVNGFLFKYVMISLLLFLHTSIGFCSFYFRLCWIVKRNMLKEGVRRRSGVVELTTWSYVEISSDLGEWWTDVGSPEPHWRGLFMDRMKVYLRYLGTVLRN